MQSVLKNMLKTKKNFVFVGEAGCGKSELAINFALNMAKISDMPVHSVMHSVLILTIRNSRTVKILLTLSGSNAILTDNTRSHTCASSNVLPGALLFCLQK